MTEAERTKLTKTAKANGKPLNGKPLNGKPSKTPSKKKPKPTPPDLPTVATHGTHVDPQDVLDALALVPGMPLPDHHTVRNVWDDQDRAFALRWAKSPTRDTDELPPALFKHLHNRRQADSALGGVEPVEPNAPEITPTSAASNVLSLYPATDTPEGGNVELSKGEEGEGVQARMTVEELREYMTREYMMNNYDPNSDDLSAILLPLGYDHERFNLEDCAPHWEEWQTRVEGRPEYPGRAAFAVAWWKEKLQSDERTDGWFFLDAYMPQEALTDCGKIFGVIVRPIPAAGADADTPTEALTDTPATDPWLLEDRPWANGDKENRTLIVPISYDRAVQLMEEQAEEYQELATLKDDKAAYNKRIGKQIKDKEARLEYLAKTVSERNEQATVECQWQYDYTNGYKRLIRVDNGELVDHARLTIEERQLQLQMEEDAHPLDAEGQPESERDRLIAECTRKALGLRPTLKALYSCIADVMDYSRDRPDGWPYNPSAAVLHTWSYDGLHDFWLMLEAIAAAHAEGDVSGWYGFLPEGAIVDLGDEALDRYWRKADDNGVMPVEESADDSAEGEEVEE